MFGLDLTKTKVYSLKRMMKRCTALKLTIGRKTDNAIDKRKTQSTNTKVHKTLKTSIVSNIKTTSIMSKSVLK